MSHPSDQLLDYAYGELEAPARTALEKHLAGCPDCTRELDGIRGVRKTFAQLAPEAAPSAGLDSLLAYAAKSAERAKEAPRKRRLWTFVTPVASLLALCLVVIVADRVRNEAAPMAAKLEAAPMAQLSNKNLNTFGTNNEPSAPAEQLPVVAVLEKARIADAKDQEREEKRAEKVSTQKALASKRDSLGALSRREHAAAKKAASSFDDLDGLTQGGARSGVGMAAGDVGGVIGSAGGKGAGGAVAQNYAPPPPPPAPEIAMAEPKPAAHRADQAKLAKPSEADEVDKADLRASKEEAEAQVASSAPAGASAEAGPGRAMAQAAPPPAAAPAPAATTPAMAGAVATRAAAPAMPTASAAKAKTRGAPAERERLIDALALAPPAQVPGLLARLCELDSREGRVKEARAECSRLLQQYGTTAEAARAKRALSTLPMAGEAAEQAQ